MTQHWIMLILAGCLSGAGYNQAAAEEPNRQLTADDVKKETKEAFEATKHYTVQQKETLHDKMQHELDEMKAKIARLKMDAARTTDKGKAETKKHIKELDKKAEAAGNRLEELKSSTAEAWDDVKSGTNKAFNDLKQSYRKALKDLD